MQSISWLLQNLSNLVLNTLVVDSDSMHNITTQAIPHFDESVSKKKNLCKSYLVRLFCSLVNSQHSLKTHNNPGKNTER